MIAQIQTPANVAAFRFRVAGGEALDLRVTAFDGIDELSDLFELCIELCSPDDSLDPQELLGLAAALEIDGQGGTRTIHGLLRRFERTGRGPNLTHYEARLVPPHWLLTKRIQSRVFNAKRCQRMDVLGIISKVLSDAGLSPAALRAATTQEYEQREFTVQYRESDWDFTCRLLEEKGIYYYFEHLSDACRLVLTDSKEIHVPFSADGAEVPFREARNLVAPREYVYTAQRCGRIEIGATALDDFDFKNPARELRVDRKRDRFTSLAFVDYPGGFVESGRGARLVQTRLDEEQCEVSVFKFAATVRGFWCGSRFRLMDHPARCRPRPRAVPDHVSAGVRGTRLAAF